MMFGNAKGVKAIGAFAVLSDADYMAGFRPNHLALTKPNKDALKFTAQVTVTEITGSETFVHLSHQGESWVGLIHGVHDLKMGTDLDVYLDPKHIYIFAKDGTSVAPASYATEA